MSLPATWIRPEAVKSWICSTGLNREQGVTIVMVTHDPDMAAYAKRIVRFLDGLVESDEPN